MNKKVLLLLLSVVGIGVIGILLVNIFAEPETTAVPIRTTEQSTEGNRPAVQAQGNTFGILTPEEAAAQAAAEAAALEAAQNATATATSTEEADPEEVAGAQEEN